MHFCQIYWLHVNVSVSPELYCWERYCERWDKWIPKNTAAWFHRNSALQTTGRTSNPKQQIIKLQEHLWAGNLRFNNQPSGGIADNDHPRKELSSGGQGLVSLSKQYQASEKLTAFYPRFYYNSKQNSSSRISIINGYRWLSIYLQKNVYTFSPYCSPRRTFLESFRFLRRYETWAVSF